MLYHGFPLLSYRQRKYIILRRHISIRNTAWFPKAFDEVVFSRTEWSLGIFDSLMTSLSFWLTVGCPLWGTPRLFAVWCFSWCQPAGPDKPRVAVGDLQPSPVQRSLEVPRTICCSWQVQPARLNEESGSALPSLKHHRNRRSCQPLTGRRFGPEPSVHTYFLLLLLLMPSKLPRACRMNCSWPRRKKSWCWEGNVTRSLELSAFKKR